VQTDKGLKLSAAQDKIRFYEYIKCYYKKDMILVFDST